MLVACGGPSAAPEGALQNPEVTSPRVDSVFARYADGPTPGAAVLVSRAGATVFKNAYGLADLDSGRPLTTTTPIRLGSLTKQFTAAAIMLLHDQGVLSFDDPASSWVPELERFGPITVRHLLNHTSGLPDYYERLEAMSSTTSEDGLLTADVAVEVYGTWGELEFPIGSAYRYSNPGYEVLGLIVERASGQSYSEFMEAHVFGPLEMDSSDVRDRPDRRISNRAVGYRPDDGDGKADGKADGEAAWVESDHHPLNWILGAGGIYATVEDLGRWHRAVFAGDLLEPETLAQALTPATLTNGTKHPYGFGWGLGDKLGRQAVHHTGGWVGFRTAMAHFPEDDLMVVVLSNASGPAEELLDDVARLYLAGG